jgi:hypothetical protein
MQPQRSSSAPPNPQSTAAMSEPNDKEATLQGTLDALAATLKSLQASVNTNSQVIQRLDANRPPSSGSGTMPSSGEHHNDWSPRF